MFQIDKWPFTPTRLSEIIDSETLAVIEAGCSSRLGRALTILDYSPERESFSYRIESINLQQHWEKFCALLRNESVIRGGERACQECDIREAGLSLAEFRSSRALSRSCPCHMGLYGMTYVVRVAGRPVALLISGQYRPAEGIDTIIENVQALGTGRYAHIHVTGEPIRMALIALATEIAPAPPDFGESLRREAEHIQRIAEAEYEQRRYQWQQAFLDDLREPTEHNTTTSLDNLREIVTDLLARIREFCRSEYAVFFASVQEGNTVLAPIAAVGVPPAVARNLPHFNWKKASLPLEGFDPKRWNIAEWSQKTGMGMASAIRGDNSDFFNAAGCILPTALGSRYRGVLVLGPFAEMVDLEAEKRFLIEVADIVGAAALTGLELHYLEQERKRWRSTAMLLTHQLRTALTPITAQVGRAKFLAQKIHRDDVGPRVVDLLRRAEDISLWLADSARQTLEGHVLHVEPEDMEFERYPLSVLLANCAEGFAADADQKHRHIVLERGVELLPEADIDVARLTIAFSNLLDNALKYSYPSTAIYVRASTASTGNLDMASALIEIDDIGAEIRLEDRERIFEQGQRGLIGAKMGRIAGTGLGLWEARAVIDAHRGEIGVTCEPTTITRSQGLAYHVIFSVRVPLRQKRNE
jgi:signal transduction histidine kinase